MCGGASRSPSSMGSVTWRRRWSCPSPRGRRRRLSRSSTARARARRRRTAKHKSKECNPDFESEDAWYRSQPGLRRPLESSGTMTLFTHRRALMEHHEHAHPWFCLTHWHRDETLGSTSPIYSWCRNTLAHVIAIRRWIWSQTVHRRGVFDCSRQRR